MLDGQTNMSPSRWKLNAAVKCTAASLPLFIYMLISFRHPLFMRSPEECRVYFTSGDRAMLMQCTAFSVVVVVVEVEDISESAAVS